MELSNTPRAASAGAGGLDDQVYQRLLKERIIFLGSVVEDSMANAICAQMLLLAAEDPENDIYQGHISNENDGPAMKERPM